jgi:DNA invertase Pin-like site-specific DNA recombinase
MAEGNSTPPLAAVAYYRMCTTAQEASIPEQREWAGPAAGRAGYELVREFADQAVPGSAVERRAELQALVEFVEQRYRQKRPVRALFVWDTDRFSRPRIGRPQDQAGPARMPPPANCHRPSASRPGGSRPGPRGG